MSLRADMPPTGTPRSQRPPSSYADDEPSFAAAAATPALYSDAVGMHPELLARMRDAHVATRAPTPTPTPTPTAARLAPPPAGRPRPIVATTGSVVAQVLGPTPAPALAPEHDLHDLAEFEHAPTDASYVLASNGESLRLFDLYYSDDNGATPVVIAAWGRKAPFYPSQVSRIEAYKARPRSNTTDVYGYGAFQALNFNNVTIRSEDKMNNLIQWGPIAAQYAEDFGGDFSTKAVNASPVSMGFGMLGANSLAADELEPLLAKNEPLRKELDPQSATFRAMQPKARPWLAPTEYPASDEHGAHFSALAVLNPYAGDALAAAKKDVWIFAPQASKVVDDGLLTEATSWAWKKMEPKELCENFGCRVLPVHVSTGGTVSYGHCLWMARREFWLAHGAGQFHSTKSRGTKANCEQWPSHFVEMHLISKPDEEGKTYEYIALINALALTAATMDPSTIATAKEKADEWRTDRYKEGTGKNAYDELAYFASYTNEGEAIAGLPDDVSPLAKAHMYSQGKPHVSLATLWSATRLATQLYNSKKNATSGFGTLVKNVYTGDTRPCVRFDPATKKKTAADRVAGAMGGAARSLRSGTAEAGKALSAGRERARSWNWGKGSTAK